MAEGKVLAIGGPRELVQQHLAAEAVEVECEQEELRPLLGTFTGRVVAVRSGRRTTLHTSDAATLAAHLRNCDGGSRRPVVVRPSNLEDVFLHLTGGGLEGGA
jgi:ABC-type multidrug transport system ATPase subunit